MKLGFKNQEGNTRDIVLILYGKDDAKYKENNS